VVCGAPSDNCRKSRLAKKFKESRMKSYLLRAFGIAGFIWGSVVNAGTSEGKITNVYTYGDGRVLVTGLMFSGATCEVNGGFWIPGNHPNLQRLLALILSAQATGATISVVAKTENCWYPEITQDPNSYVILKSE
jgi:hypothetical protein